MIPRPRTNLLVYHGYHGAFASRGCFHESAVIGTHRDAETKAPAQSSPAESAPAVPGMSATTEPPDGCAPTVYACPLHFPWADLLRRTFAIDILACPQCGGSLCLVATIAPRYGLWPTRGGRLIGSPNVPSRRRAVVSREKILMHLGLPVDPPSPVPARLPEWLPGMLSGLDDGTGQWSD